MGGMLSFSFFLKRLTRRPEKCPAAAAGSGVGRAAPLQLPPRVEGIVSV